MKSDLMTQFSRPQRESLESAGYRIVRWMAAREVLQARVTKGRIAGTLGEFLTHWLSLASPDEAVDELWLSFDHELKLNGGNAGLATSPLERALLHLPALRSFWSQELRRQHFAALRALVPQAWLLDPAGVPPGAVIQGLGAPSWAHTSDLDGEIHNLRGRLPENRDAALASRDSIWIARPSGGVKLNARYGRDVKAQVVLRSLEAAP